MTNYEDTTARLLHELGFNSKPDRVVFRRTPVTVDNPALTECFEYFYREGIDKVNAWIRVTGTGFVTEQNTIHVWDPKRHPHVSLHNLLTGDDFRDIPFDLIEEISYQLQMGKKCRQDGHPARLAAFLLKNGLHRPIDGKRVMDVPEINELQPITRGIHAGPVAQLVHDILALERIAFDEERADDYYTYTGLYSQLGISFDTENADDDNVRLKLSMREGPVLQFLFADATVVSVLNSAFSTTPPINTSTMEVITMSDTSVGDTLNTNEKAPWQQDPTEFSEQQETGEVVTQTTEKTLLTLAARLEKLIDLHITTGQYQQVAATLIINNAVLTNILLAITKLPEFELYFLDRGWLLVYDGRREDSNVMVLNIQRDDTVIKIPFTLSGPPERLYIHTED